MIKTDDNNSKHIKSFIYKPLTRYLLPFLLFAIFSEFEHLVDYKWKFLLYTTKIFFSFLAFLILFKGFWHELKGKFDWIAVVVGIAVLMLWLCPYFFFNKKPVFTTTLSHNFKAVMTYFFCTSIIIPIFEEIFWRSFLMRFFISIDFLSIKLGTYRHLSFWLTAVMFALLHSKADWGVAFIAGIAYGWYLVKSKNLIGCIIAHSITNFGLTMVLLVIYRLP